MEKMCQNGICPAMKAIEEIRGGGWAEESPAVMIGGSGGIEVVCDAIKFYMASRKLRIARAKIDKKDVSREMFGDFWKDGRPISRGKLYEKIMGEVSSSGISAQLFAILDAVDSLEKLVYAKATKDPAKSLTLPDIILPAEADVAAFYIPSVLCAVTNRIVEYINRLNVNSLIAKPVLAKIEKIDEKSVPEGLPRPDEKWFEGELSADIDAMFSAESEVIKFAQSAEEFHVIAAKKMCEIFAVVEEISVQLAP